MYVSTFCFTVLSLITIVLIYTYLSSLHKHWERLNVPYAKPESLFGSARRMLLLKENLSVALQRLYDQLQGHKFGGFFMLTTPCILVRDPDLINRILIGDFMYFHDRMNFPQFQTDPMTHHIFTMGGALWKEMRQRISQPFSISHTRKAFFLIQECCTRLQSSVQAAFKGQRSREFELKDLLSSFSTDVIGMCFFGIECGAIDDTRSQFRRISKMIFDTSKAVSFRQTLMMMSPTLSTLLRMKFFSASVAEFFDRIVMETITYREKNGIIRDDLINLMMQLKKDGLLIVGNGETIEITDKFLVGQMLVAFALGFEMTSTAMSFCLHELSLHSDLQIKARMEVDTVLGRHGGEITYEGVQEMEYLEAVVAETMRLYPPQGFLMRQCTEPYKIPGTTFVVEKGTVVYVPVLALQRDEQFFDEPLHFSPERFMRGSQADTHRMAATYLPFGLGPRSCLGQKFAMTEVKAGLAALLSLFEFQPCPRSYGSPAPIEPCKIITAPAGGLWVRLSPRSWLPLS